MRKTLALAALLAASPALAQQAAPPYAPITISEDEYRRLETYLGDQPMKFSAPIAQWLVGAENRAAMEAKAKADDKAPADRKMEPQPVPSPPPSPSR